MKQSVREKTDFDVEDESLRETVKRKRLASGLRALAVVAGKESVKRLRLRHTERDGKTCQNMYACACV